MRPAILAAILTLGGCASAPPPAPVVVPQVVEDASLAALRRAEAASTGAERARLYLAALVQVYGQGDLEQAAVIVSRIARYADELEDIERFRLGEIALELELRKSASAVDTEAEAMLAGLRPVTRAQRLTAAQLHARLLARSTGSSRKTALAWIAVAEHPDARAPDQETAVAETWRHLTRLPPLEAGELARDAPTAMGRAWAALARDYNAALTDVLRSQVWQDWQKANAGHLAARSPAPGLTAIPRKPANVALLVPLSGALGGAGKAVRDGFTAALLYAESGSREPLASPATTVRLYDTAAADAADLFRQAVSEGAEIVVGPLRKSAVAAVVAQRPTVPVLALNRLDDAAATVASPVPQLALAPEDDASAIATALADGAARRIVLFDSGAPGATRAKARLLAELGDVEVVATARLGTLSDVARVVGDALAVTASSQRHTDLAAVLGIDIEFTPRRRDDVDAVVAFVTPEQFASLDAALGFHFADDVPVFAPWSAVGSASQLDEVYVCGIPWQLHPGALRTAARPFAASRGVSAPWFAFGIDGFRLASQWQRLTSDRGPIAGSTGLLTLGADGRIDRRPVWAVIRGGRLVPHVPGRPQ